MVEGKRKLKHIIKASEIVDYLYCSVSWSLKRRGFKPNSDAIKKGIELHQEVGKTVTKLEKQERVYSLTSSVGYLLLFAVIVMFGLVVIGWL